MGFWLEVAGLRTPALQPYSYCPPFPQHCKSQHSSQLTMIRIQNSQIIDISDVTIQEIEELLRFRDASLLHVMASSEAKLKKTPGHSTDERGIHHSSFSVTANLLRISGDLSHGAPSSTSCHYNAESMASQYQLKCGTSSQTSPNSIKDSPSAMSESSGWCVARGLQAGDISYSNL